MSRRTVDLIAGRWFCATAVLAASIVLLILVFVVREASSALSDIGVVRFLTDDTWRPTAGAKASYGIIPMLAGSLFVTSGAVIVAGVPGVLSALLIRFYAPPFLATIHRRVIELLAGVPSVVFGFWGLVVLVPIINRLHPPGQSLLAGILILSLMILPTIALTAEAALRGVPASYSSAAAALGMGRWATIWNVSLPVARRGILAGFLLAATRAIGETMAVVMVCGNIVQVPDSLFAPVRTVTANIAMEMGDAQAEHRSALFLTGLALMVLVALFLIAAGGPRRSEVS
ncbi:MAG: phosphate ABC transporter permease subunit PstC [Planctomycetota bacterium]|nr:phosphate ABC transporter permease subunit PstC [Planctomycetota bacterium]MDA1163166.1 phosphate ABC transporter permease subunit PstC [Planctomycetota bacterium]